MVQVCKGVCELFEPNVLEGHLRYGIGQKWCSLCALFFTTQEANCPCCKTRLRTSARNKNRKRKEYGVFS